MFEHEALVDRILAASGIVGRQRRCDAERELRSHIEEIVEEERARGRGDQEIERLVALRFGQPDEIAGQFASVYRSQRLGLSLLSYSLLAVFSVCVVASFVYAIQYGVALWLGIATAPIFTRTHLGSESALLAGLTLGYLGLYFAERLFMRKRFLKALALVALIFAAIAVGLELAGFGGGAEIGAGFLFACFVRALERIFAHSALRLAGVLIFFAVIAKLAPYLMPCSSRSLTWLYLAIAVSSQFVAYFAGIFDRQILKRHFA